ncbi:barstar family protein [Streptomyces solincola]|uniref:barstar family protein n=1 Tax=Streptomyces solincola TaxID=2100817 RepID=UPI0011B2490F|nr:barstar family protein [Streptomyces solincola]
MLVDDESGETLIAAAELDGFFVQPDREPPEVTFRNVCRFAAGRREVDSAVLRIVNHREDTIGEYYIGPVRLRAAEARGQGAEHPAVFCEMHGDRGEYPEAEDIWRRWVLDRPLQEGEWAQQSAYRHIAWLHVVQNAWFATGHRAARYGSADVVLLDGSRMPTTASFYVALGEAVNGAGGYFGSNLDALADCLSSDCGQGNLKRIVWREARISRRLLPSGFPEAAADVLREYGVQVDME